MTPRYSDAELEAMLAELESDLVERKESAKEADGIRRNICALANDLPGHGRAGVVFVGVRDDGSCAHLDVTDDLLKRLAQMHDDGSILPLPSMIVQRRSLGGCPVAVVLVEPAPDTPVRYRGGTFVRIGPTVRLASAAEERQLGYNAVMHRSNDGTNAPVRIYWYADRVEISSPGGLYGKMTPDNFGAGDTDYRNPLVAEIMHHLGFAQRFGLGLMLASDALAKNGNPEPEFDLQPTLVRVAVRAAL